MKITFAPKPCASALIITLIFVMTIAGILGTYLVMVLNSDKLVVRSQYWNSALAIAEAGIEEGLTAVNSGISNSLSSGVTRNLNGGTYTVWYNVASGTNLVANITSIGTVTVPITGDKISRTVVVKASQSALFLMGLVAIYNIDFNGNSVASDSWNSYNPFQSTNGLYNGYVGTNGDVASVYGIVNIGKHTICGNLFLGPDATYTSGAGQVTGTIYTDANLNFKDAALPTNNANGNPISWNSAPTSNNTHTITNSGYYTISDSYPVVVNPGLNVTLDVQTPSWAPNALNIGGSTTNSANVALYLESGSITLGGNSSGGASGNRPGNLIVYGLPAVTSITLSGKSSFIGAIYAPEATLTLNGGGNGYNIMGAVVGKSVTLNGHYDFHYDTALATNSINRGFVVASWQEQ